MSTTIPAPIASLALAESVALLGDELARRFEAAPDPYTQASLYALSFVENVLRETDAEDLAAAAALAEEFLSAALDAGDS